MPAGAGEWADRDARGDVTTDLHSPEPPPCGTWTEQVLADDEHTDITRVRVRHTRRELRVAVRFRDLRARGHHDTVVSLRTPRRDLMLEVSRHPGSARAHVALTSMPDLDALADEMLDEECGIVGFVSSEQRCAGIRGHLDHVRDRVVAAVPRRCLGTPRWVRARVSAYSSGPADGAPLRADRWEPRDATAPNWAGGHLGPKVRVG